MVEKYFKVLFSQNVFNFQSKKEKEINIYSLKTSVVYSKLAFLPEKHYNFIENVHKSYKKFVFNPNYTYFYIETHIKP